MGYIWQRTVSDSRQLSTKHGERVARCTLPFASSRPACEQAASASKPASDPSSRGRQNQVCACRPVPLTSQSRSWPAHTPGLHRSMLSAVVQKQDFTPHAQLRSLLRTVVRVSQCTRNQKLDRKC